MIGAKSLPSSPDSGVWIPSQTLSAPYNAAYFDQLLPSLQTVGVAYDPRIDYLSVLDDKSFQRGRVGTCAGNILKTLREDNPPAAFSQNEIIDYEFDEEATVRAIHLVLAQAVLEIGSETYRNKPRFTAARSDLLELLSSVPRPIHRFRDLSRFPAAKRGSNILNIYNKSAAANGYSSSPVHPHVNEVRAAVNIAATNIPSYALHSQNTQSEPRSARTIQAVSTPAKATGFSKATTARTTGRSKEKSPFPQKSNFDAAISAFRSAHNSDNNTSALDALDDPRTHRKIMQKLYSMKREEKIEWAETAITGYFEKLAASQPSKPVLAICQKLSSSDAGRLSTVMALSNRYTQFINNRTGGFEAGIVAGLPAGQAKPLPESNFESFLPEAFARLMYVAKKFGASEDEPELEMYGHFVNKILAAAFPKRNRD